ncbi:hypothetical protein MtrunA17_Chr1g0203301 [Medicago truncatula]|uniref:Transmembrane protein, putative n=1 Tax=Medicago truncatula TaxID=3880 RepID=A0A072VNV5_MEDTR|nr:transmembrane protein, putative [Medicago truncatula]RHN81825.1 hypothetical protein MtrunA17_Chr1g0203301 [Medicago truncatula]
MELLLIPSKLIEFVFFLSIGVPVAAVRFSGVVVLVGTSKLHLRDVVAGIKMAAKEKEKKKKKGTPIV